ncbi:hypothetical protein [Novipirellula artificiosorum]|uniref:Uncharacterized protein n=1 Tax=Novipirellula artificiosorum TaxID=2528016 RepID=A0A5C6DH92_9BACT|nr:hypothetical protein [Novipirellula artificiosorum]TWU36018.1 hypothetical protein Poly41_37710 [Novipirellula artificiosorum]
MSKKKFVSLRTVLPPAEQQARVEALFQSDEWLRIKAMAEDHKRRYKRLGDGDDSIHRTLIELAQALNLSVNEVEKMNPNELDQYTDAILRRRGVKSDIIDTQDARKLLGTTSNKSLKRWADEAGVKSVSRGRWRRSDILKIKSNRET